MSIRNIYHRIIPQPVQQWRNDTWYGLQRRLAWMTDARIQQMSTRLLPFKGKYSGQRCFIMGNGPSLNKMELNLFEHELVWGANKCYLLFDRINWRPSFYTAVDTRVVPDMTREIRNVIAGLPGTNFFFPVFFRERWLLQSAKNVYWYNEKLYDDTNLPWGMFSTDPPVWVSSVRTVTIASLQLAVYLGFNPIYLIGCDTSYSIPASVKYEDGDRDRLISLSNDDPNHFAAGYFVAGSKWHDPHVDQMIFHYRQVKTACDTLGVKVFNATVGGNLGVFPRVDYRDLF